jgi:NADPH:quinone reductase-like Zn-dependent oxidoreductase
MKAVLFYEHGGPEKLVYEDAPEPKAGDGEVVIQVKACALNHLDIWVRQGIPAYKLALPHISGCDIAGVVHAVGPGVESVILGQRVFVAPGLSCWKCEACLAGRDNQCATYRVIGASIHGGYAEYVKVPAMNCLLIPEKLSFDEAAAFPLVSLTSWHMLMSRARLAPGETALIHGVSSGVGSAALQIAKLVGATTIVTASQDENLDKAQRLGADHTINYKNADVAKRVRELTGGRGVDVVLEHIGPATWEQSLQSLVKGGRLVTCGATTGPQVTLDLRYVYSRELTVLGSYLGTRAELATVAKLVGGGKLSPVIGGTFPLREAKLAQERMLQRQFFGKLILKP